MDVAAAVPAAVCTPPVNASALCGAVATVAAPLAAGAATDFADDLARSLAVSLWGGSSADAAGLADSREMDSSEEEIGDSGEPATELLSSLWVQLGIASLPAPKQLAGEELSRVPGGSGSAKTAASTLAAAMPSSPTSIATPEVAPTLAVSLNALSPVIATDAVAKDPVPAAGTAEISPAVAASPVAALVIPETIRASHHVVAPAVVDLKLPQAPQQIAENVVWMLGKDISEVRIRLNPEDLGPLDVHLKLDGDKLSVRFDMADASVKDIVQTSLPSLATLLSARGLQLDQAQVFSHSRGFQQGQTQAESARGGANGESDEPVVRTRVVSRRGLVDDYV